MDPISAIGAVGSLAGGIANIFGQSAQQQQQQAALQQAMLNYQLQKREADRQYELSTASRTDARGNKVSYVPGVGWTTTVTPQTDAIIKSSDAIERANNVRNLTVGQQEKTTNMLRRQEEGQAANPLLNAIRYQFGAPTREGVEGANTVAGVTSAGEAGDNAKGGYTAAALRTGSGGVPLAQTLASADKGTTQGIRSSIAQTKAQAPALYNTLLNQFTSSKLDPYNTLASRASNVNDTPFAPETLSSGLNSMNNNAGYIGAATVGRNAPNLNASSALLQNAYGSVRQPNYDSLISGGSDLLTALFRKNKNQGPIYDSIDNLIDAQGIK